MKTLRSLLVLCLVAAAALPATTAATDSHAPRGARGDWLPADAWVMSQWLPYDEATLHRVLRTNRRARRLARRPARARPARAPVSPRRIAAVAGRTEAQLRASLLRMLAERGRRAVRLRATSPRQARALLREQTAGVDAFVRRP